MLHISKGTEDLFILEPMNPYEKKVIVHTAVKKDPYVTTQ